MKYLYNAVNPWWEGADFNPGISRDESFPRPVYRTVSQTLLTLRGRHIIMKNISFL